MRLVASGKGGGHGGDDAHDDNGGAGCVAEVPVIIGSGGVEKIIELNLSPEEKNKRSLKNAKLLIGACLPSSKASGPGFVFTLPERRSSKSKF